MLSEKRIEQAQNNVRQYLSEGLLRKTTEKTAKPILLKNAQDSLKASKIMLEQDIPLWTIVSAYYAMFYISQAVLLELGYKVGDKIVHKVTTDGIITLVRQKLKSNILEHFDEVQAEAMRLAEIKSDNIIESLEFERRKRGFIQYQTPKEDITQKAKTSFERAKEFVYEMENLLK